MSTVTINRFYRGKADDRFSSEVGKFSIAKHFDVLTYKKKLQPLRGMTAHTASTGIGNLVVASDGLMYGTGLNSSNGRLYVLAGYGGGDDFAPLSTSQLSGAPPNYDFIVDWAECGNSRQIHWASTNLLIASNYSGGAGSATTQSLTFTSIGQGLVHPKNGNLYFPYTTSSSVYVGLITPNATPFAGLNATAFALPSGYRAYCLSHYGDYLAIPLTSTSTTSRANNSIVSLWDKQTSNTLAEPIPWGEGVLKVLNNIAGSIIGVSELGSNTLQAGTSQDYNAIQIRVWNGSGEPEVVAEIKTTALSGSTGIPSVSVNERVNFVKNNRLYFSAVVNPNDGIQPSRVGLWSVGKNELGEWTVNLERMATNGSTETSIIAAAMVGDYVEMVHTAVGTLTKSTNGFGSNTTYGATSVYESLVNPEMDVDDKWKKKKLIAISVNFEPLPSSASIVFKYRVDSKGKDSDWVSMATFSTAGDVHGETTTTSTSSDVPVEGYNYEFRIESTGGAVITSYSYSYKALTSSNLP